MTRTPRSPSRRSDAAGGFTLIELLVVLVILGILSGVVVFAVRGSGDKGKANAIATDARIIRTAQEAYCAKAGHYGTVEQLTGAEPSSSGQTYKFLSEAPEYHTVATFAGAQGCNGSRFRIDCADGSPMPACSTESLPPGEPRWIPSGNLPFESQYDRWEIPGMMKMDGTGKIVTIDLNRVGPQALLYDAAARKWSDSTVFGIETLEKTVVTPGEASPTCPNCGKVLIQRHASLAREWVLYDPVLQTLAPVPPSNYTCVEGTSLTALADGRVLKAGCTYNWHKAEIYDPKTQGYPWAKVADTKFPHDAPLTVRLDDDRVLVLGNRHAGAGATRVPAEIFNPSTGTWTVVAAPSFQYAGAHNSAVLLPDGRVLAIAGAGEAELYDPVADTWTSAGECPCDRGRTATLLNSGRVLVAGGYTGGLGEGSPRVHVPTATLFDYKTNKWLPTTSMPTARSAHTAQLLGGRDCAADCGKVIVTGGQAAEGEASSTFLFSETG